MELNIKSLHHSANIPTYATLGSACFDLYAIDEESMVYDAKANAETWRTGLAFEVPDGFAMLVFSRSGHGFNENTRLANCVGVIDSDFRGEVKVKLTRDDRLAVTANEGDRIAQAMLVPVSQVRFNVVQELSSTERGDGGFGSSGKK